MGGVGVVVGGHVLNILRMEKVSVPHAKQVGNDSKADVFVGVIFKRIIFGQAQNKWTEQGDAFKTRLRLPMSAAAAHN